MKSLLLSAIMLVSAQSAFALNKGDSFDCVEYGITTKLEVTSVNVLRAPPARLIEQLNFWC